MPSFARWSPCLVLPFALACGHAEKVPPRVDPDRLPLYAPQTASRDKSSIEDLPEDYRPGELSREKQDRRIELHPDEATTIRRFCLPRNPGIEPAELRGQCFQRECTSGPGGEKCVDRGDPRIEAVAEAEYGKEFVESHADIAAHRKETARLRKACLDGGLASCERWHDHIRGGDYDQQVERFRAEVCRAPMYSCTWRRDKAAGEAREVQGECALLKGGKILSCERMDAYTYERLDVRAKDGS